MDKYLRRLEAVMIVCDANVSLTLTGTGDVLEPVDGVIGIGSGGMYATAAARALLDVPGMDAEQIGRKAMGVAADICVYTNREWVSETIESAADSRSET
jgi:ATP-dependent HslUV protease subunit HslV